MGCAARTIKCFGCTLVAGWIALLGFTLLQLYSLYDLPKFSKETYSGKLMAPALQPGQDFSVALFVSPDGPHAFPSSTSISDLAASGHCLVWNASSKFSWDAAIEVPEFKARIITSQPSSLDGWRQPEVLDGEHAVSISSETMDTILKQRQAYAVVVVEWVHKGTTILASPVSASPLVVMSSLMKKAAIAEAHPARYLLQPATPSAAASPSPPLVGWREGQPVAADGSEVPGTSSDQPDRTEHSSAKVGRHRRGSPSSQSPRRKVPQWRSSVSIRVVVEHGSFPTKPSDQPDVISGTLIPHRRGSKSSRRQYLPLVALNPYPAASSDLVPLNDTVTSLPLQVDAASISVGMFAIHRMLALSVDQLLEQGFPEDGVDELLGILLHTKTSLLLLVFAVSGLHLALDILATMADVQFFRSLEGSKRVGLSSRTICLNCVCYIVILLYLVDKGSSVLVVYPHAAACLVEFWKLARVLDFQWEWVAGFVPIPVWRPQTNLVAAQASAHDREAFMYLGLAFVPILFGYSAYSLLYQMHQGWYQWMLSSAAAVVYSLGFAMMTPQLFLNMRLRSVASLPWRALVYRSLNTFIDDLFAFIIRMPDLQRLSVLRDDVIFLIYLYQRWIYPVDKTRAPDGTNCIQAEQTKPDSALVVSERPKTE